MRKVKCIILTIIVTVAITACGEAEAITEPDTSEYLIKAEKQTYEAPEELAYSSILIDESNISIEKTLKKGDCVDIPHKLGYTFKGYCNENGVFYIDETGNVVKDYHGVSSIKLFQQFEADKYQLLFVLNDNPLENIADIYCAYDADFTQELPFGRMIGNDSCIISFSIAGGKKEFKKGTPRYTIEDISEYVDEDAKTLTFNVATTHTTCMKGRLDTCFITDDGPLKQKLDSAGRGYDIVDISKEIDIQALRDLGYQEVRINIDVSIADAKGYQRVLILTEQPEKEKQLKDKNVCLLDSGEIKDIITETQEKGNYLGETTFGIDFMKDILYVAYDAGGSLGKDEWKSDGMTMTITFIK